MILLQIALFQDAMFSAFRSVPSRYRWCPENNWLGSFTVSIGECRANVCIAFIVTLGCRLSFFNSLARPFLKTRKNAWFWRVTKDFAYMHWPKKKKKTCSTSLRDLAVIAPCQKVKKKWKFRPGNTKARDLVCVLFSSLPTFCKGPLAWRCLGRVQFTQFSSPCGTRRDFYFASLLTQPLCPSYRFPSVPSAVFFSVFFFFFRLRVFFVIAVQWYRGTQNRFECVNKFKVTKKEIERRLFLSHLGSRFPPPSRAPASCSAILIVPDRTPRAIQRLGLKSMQQHGIRRSFPCSVSFNESVCEIAISLSAVLAATCSARERMRATQTALATRKRGPFTRRMMFFLDDAMASRISCAQGSRLTVNRA